MTADLNQFPELDKTKFEQRGIQLEIGVPVTCAVSIGNNIACLLYTSPSPRDGLLSRMPSSA